jgi:hypothetical protein
MKWARKVNNFAVDVRTTSPEGYYTEEVVAQFIIVPNEVEHMWFYDEATQTWLPEEPQPPAPPEIEVTRV